MEKKSISSLISREKHIDHMINMLPILTLSFAIHGFILMDMSPHETTKDLLVLMAFTLIAAVCSLAAYDFYHQVDLSHHKLITHYRGYLKQEIDLDQIQSLECINEKSSFGHLKVILKSHRSLTIYFIDNPTQTKKMIEDAIGDQSTQTSIAA